MVQFKHWNTFKTYLAICILAPLLVLLAPVFLLLFTPIFVFRYLVSLFSGLLKPDLGKILNSESAVFATDDMYNKPKSTLVFPLIVQSELDVKQVMQEFNEKVIQRQSLEDELKYPELQQCISTWMGFYFWKWEQDFQIQNHIREYDGLVKYNSLNEQTLLAISNELIEKAWTQHESPWEILICHNYWPQMDATQGTSKTACILRFHHSLVDAISIIKLVTDLAGEELNIARPTYIQKSLCRQVVDGLTFCFRVPWEVSCTLVKSNEPLNQFHRRHDQTMSNRYTLVTSPKIPLRSIKEIRDLYECSFAGITLAAFAGALRTCLLESAENVPDIISVALPIARPGHPNKLRNHANVILTRLPVGISDVRMRLRFIEAELKNLRNSTLPVFTSWLSKAAGSLFPFMVRFATNQNGPTAVVSSVPGPNQGIRLFGQPVLDWSFVAGFGVFGMALLNMSYDGHIRFTFGIDQSILSNSKISLDGFMDNMLKELDILKSQHTEVV